MAFIELWNLWVRGIGGLADADLGLGCRILTGAEEEGAAWGISEMIGGHGGPSKAAI
jgi:hypothetical protein